MDRDGKLPIDIHRLENGVIETCHARESPCLSA
ncbi:hypothetical protein NC652_031572 [Populus alba x Populus x berolinensis]|nr:hypothetical protein NC652_031572 [Populus alba x Populus x berolinensis]